MPRKSLSELTTAPPVVVQLFPAPPSQLNKRAGEVWESIVKSRPANYFDPAQRVLLGAFCQHVASFERASKELERELAGGASDERMVLLTKLRSVESSALSGLATRLRLTQQSQLSPNTARTAAAQGARLMEDKPWESKPKQRKRKAAPAKLEQEAAS